MDRDFLMFRRQNVMPGFTSVVYVSLRCFRKIGLIICLATGFYAEKNNSLSFHLLFDSCISLLFGYRDFTIIWISHLFLQHFVTSIVLGSSKMYVLLFLAHIRLTSIFHLFFFRMYDLDPCLLALYMTSGGSSRQERQG